MAGGKRVEIMDDADLGLAVLIAEFGVGNYQPVAAVVSINEAREIAASDMRARRNELERGGQPSCPERYVVWAQGPKWQLPPRQRHRAIARLPHSPRPPGTGGLAVVKYQHFTKEQNMIFTIDNDNDIRVHETEAQADEAVKAAAGTILVRSEKELANAAAEWPASRLVELWNSFAGVAPFTECKPVKKFENRDKAVARIWTAIQRLGNGIAPNPPEDAEPAAPKASRSARRAPKAGDKPKAKAKAKSAAKAKGKAKKAAAGKPREGTHKAQVIAMLQRKGGATLDQM